MEVDHLRCIHKRAVRSEVILCQIGSNMKKRKLKSKIGENKQKEEKHALLCVLFSLPSLFYALFTLKSVKKIMWVFISESPTLWNFAIHKLVS